MITAARYKTEEPSTWKFRRESNPEHQPSYAMINLLQVQGPVSMPTGLEWLPIASVLVPTVLLIVLIYLARRAT